MPHKHTRRQNDPSSFNLPPNQIARPLPVTRGRNAEQPAATSSSVQNPTTSRKRRKRTSDDDTPRAFKRLMALAQGKKQRSGLDDGQPPINKKRPKVTEQKHNAENKTVEKSKMPTIRPGESMSDFTARVNAALPLAGLVSKTVKNAKDPLGLKVQRTRKERKMHKLYDQWREEERKIQERREEDLELAAERELDEEINGGTFRNLGVSHVDGHVWGGKNKRKSKKGKGASGEDDPWAELTKTRGEAKPGLHDVAQAPPELSKVSRQKLLVRGAAVDVSNVPKSAGSLRNREELQGIREDLIAAYRRGKAEKLARLGGAS
ncbi:hypothetical protein Cob_v003587 [Colletotrichum orbiculare MAFF 240422]|uniref:Urease accessory protein n=1 Tax=Colletotrichum orbiculare (strain 104-T / ATCC 96160 / CBS 514.97 / LARS 414 / MAFF 240422) TaxID=1213857 RepID=A0A484FZW3_COLOR|nr:hypothetical protein Cob_v003587 [Colletotrichum orbiculare MAFF 240422]